MMTSRAAWTDRAAPRSASPGQTDGRNHPVGGLRRGEVMTRAPERARAPEPPDAGERELLLGWLAFHRDTMAAKCAGLSPDELVAAAALPSRLTLLGLVRHLTEMERVYAAYALGPPGALHFVYGDYEDEGPEWDFDVDASLVEESMAAWQREREAADAAIASPRSLHDADGANGR